MDLWDTSPSSSRSVGFPNKVTIPCPNSSSLQFIGQSSGEQYKFGLDNRSGQGVAAHSSQLSLSAGITHEVQPNPPPKKKLTSHDW